MYVCIKYILCLYVCMSVYKYVYAYAYNWCSRTFVCLCILCMMRMCTCRYMVCLGITDSYIHTYTGYLRRLRKNLSNSCRVHIYIYIYIYIYIHTYIHNTGYLQRLQKNLSNSCRVYTYTYTYIYTYMHTQDIYEAFEKIYRTLVEYKKDQEQQET